MGATVDDVEMVEFERFDGGSHRLGGGGESVRSLCFTVGTNIAGSPRDVDVANKSATNVTVYMRRVPPPSSETNFDTRMLAAILPT